MVTMQNLTVEGKEKGFSTASEFTEPKVMRTIKFLYFRAQISVPCYH